MSKQGFILGIYRSRPRPSYLRRIPFFILDVIQNAIVVQLGKPVRNVTEGGLYLKMPFIEEVTYFDKRLWTTTPTHRTSLRRTRKRCCSTICQMADYRPAEGVSSVSKLNGAPCNDCTTLFIPNSA